MAITAFTIGGASKLTALEQPGLRIAEEMNGRNTLSCGVLAEDETYRPAAGAEVYVNEGLVRIFGGLVDAQPEEAFGVAGGAVVLLQLSATDFNAYLDAKHLTGLFEGGTLKAWLQWVLPLLTPHGVTLHASQDDGPVGVTLPAIPYSDTPLTEAFSQISTIVNRPYEIDYQKKLSMLAQTGQAAPFDLEEGDGLVEGDLTVEPVTYSDYRDKVILKFTGSGARAYAFLTASVNWADGESVTLGGQSYTFKSALTGTAGQVLIGASVDESLQRLAAAVTLAGGAGSTYTEATTLNGAAGAFPFGEGVMKAFALEIGAAGNNISATTTNSAATWYTEGGIPCATLTLGADQALTERVTAGTGLRELLQEEPTVRDATVAQLMADALLVRAMASPKIVHYTTDQVGVHPGQVQTITWPSRNLSGSFLITDVEITNTDGLEMRRTVTAYGGTAIPTRWQDDAKRMFSGSSSGATTGVGGFVVGGGTSGPIHADLGGSRIGVRKTATWLEIPEYVVWTCLVAGVYTLRTERRTTSAATSVQVRLYDLDAAAAVVTGATSVDTADWSAEALPATLIAGHRYRAEVQGGNASAEIQVGQATVEKP